MADDLVRNMDMPEAAGTQSVDRALSLLELILRGPDEGLGLGALVAASGLNRATVRRLLLALIRGGLVAQEPDSRLYHLGDQAQALGARAMRRPGLVQAATASVAALAQATGDAALLSVRRGDHALCLMREEGDWPLRTHALMPGQVHPLGVGAGSLAMLAALPHDEARAVIAANASRIARDYPMHAPERLLRRIARARSEGIALNPGRVIEGSWGLGLALFYADGRLAGALSIAAVEARMRSDRIPELIRLLRAEGGRIEARLAQGAQKGPT